MSLTRRRGDFLSLRVSLLALRAASVRLASQLLSLVADAKPVLNVRSSGGQHHVSVLGQLPTSLSTVCPVQSVQSLRHPHRRTDLPVELAVSVVPRSDPRKPVGGAHGGFLALCE